MPSIYHQRTLDLLDDEEILTPTSTDSLERWASEFNVQIPASVLEWVRIGGQRLLEKYSNMDNISLDEPKLVTTPDGTRGLLYFVENQANYSQIVTLDNGDDPPVLNAWAGDTPWITHWERFSDAVFAQIFDWQYLLEFPDGEPEIAFYGEVECQSEEDIDILRETFYETVSTKVVVDNETITQFRFYRSDLERVTVSVCPRNQVVLQITGEKERVFNLEAELLEEFSEDLLLPGFGYLWRAVSELDRLIQIGLMTKVSFMFMCHPDPLALDRLVACHFERPFLDRLRGSDFPEAESVYRVGGPEWGLAIWFRRVENGF